METTLMNAAALHARAQRASFAVKICAAFPTVGSVTMTTTVRTTQMKGTVNCGLVILVTSSVTVVTVSLNVSSAMATPTVWTIQMRRHVRPAFRTAHTVPPSCSSARTTYVSSLIGNVMETMTAGTVQTRSFTSAWKFSVRLRSVSAVTTTVASTATSCVTLLMTAVTALMRDRKTAKAPHMVPVQMMSTNAVTDNASLYNMPVMIMMTVETSRMSLAATSTVDTLAVATSVNITALT